MAVIAIMQLRKLNQMTTRIANLKKCQITKQSVEKCDAAIAELLAKDG